MEDITTSNITQYTTSDGQKFFNKEEAENHNEFIKLMEWYEENKLSGRNYGSSIYWEDLFDWFCENKQQVRKILKYC